MIRVGIIGTGLIAREHAQSLAMTAGKLTLTTAADMDPGRLQAFCRDFNVKQSCADAGELIASQDVDLVVITTPPAAHEAFAVDALNRGKLVVCEKPLAHSMASAMRIAKAAARYPGRLTVSHQLRWVTPFRRLRWLCDHGWIGTIESAEIQRHGYTPNDENGSHGWWGRWSVAGGGVLITQVIHELDMLLLTMGYPASVTAEADTRYTNLESEDHIEATFQFDGGRTARCVASVNSAQRGGSFALHGTKGSIRIPWELKLRDPADHVRAIRELDRALPQTEPASASLAARAIRAAASRLGMRAHPELTPHAHLYLDVAASIARQTALPIPPADALRPLELCMGAYESAITGKAVTFPLTRASAVYEGISKEMYEARSTAVSRVTA